MGCTWLAPCRPRAVRYAPPLAIDVKATLPEELDRYVEAWSRPGAAEAMIDYYRAAVRLGSKQNVRPISAPTLVIWGQGDRYLGPKLAEPHHDDVPNLDRVERLPNASHWVHHDEAERVEPTARRLLRPPRESENGRTSIA